MVRSQRRLLAGIVVVTAAFLPLDFIFGAPQTPGLIASRVLLFGGFGGVAWLLPRLSSRGRTVALTLIGAMSPIAVGLMVWGTGGTTSPAFSFMWALPMLVGMVCLEEPTADLAATVLTAIVGTMLLVSEARGAAQIFYFLMVTVTGGGLGTLSTWMRRKNHRAELQRTRENEALLAAMIEAMPAGVIMADGSGAARYTNAPLRSLLGEPSSLELECLKKALHGETSTASLQLPSPAGVRDVEIRGAPLLGLDGKVTHGIALILDVTERKRTEAALEEAQRRLAQADRISSLGTLAGGVAHQINNPLAFVVTNLSFVAEQLAGHDDVWLRDVREALSDAQAGATRVGDTVRDLKVFASTHEEKVERLDVAKCIDAAVLLTTNEVRHRAQLARDLAPGTHVMANGPQLVQVFAHLLSNAAHAIADGHAQSNTITVKTSVDGDTVVIAVSDTGHGIAPEVLPRIFEPFFTTRSQGEGTGLGLAMCHGVVKKLGGEISVESTVGQGSTFSLKLKAAPAPVVVPVAPTAAATSQQRQTIVVIDDDAMVGKSVKRMLERQYDVHLFADGREALQWLKQGTRCDAILCDVMMPLMSGADFMAALKVQRPELCDRVVFATGGAFSASAKKLAATAKFCLEKPFMPDVLLSTLREVLQRA